MKTKLTILLSVLISLNAFSQYNTYYGKYAGPIGVNQNDLQGASAFGVNAKVSVDDGLVLGDTSLVKVGIGLSNPKYRLDVKGVFNMRTAFNTPSIKINDSNFLELDAKGQFVLNRFKIKYDSELQWSDKVFEPAYQLMPLPEVAAFIQKNKHLPNVPSASEVVKNGVDVNEMVSKLLEKVEELTLYIVEQQKEIDLLKEKVINIKN